MPDQDHIQERLDKAIATAELLAGDLLALGLGDQAKLVSDLLASLLCLRMRQ